MGNEQDILSLNLIETWNIYKNEAELGSKDFKRVREGIMIKFDLINYLENFNVAFKEKKGIIIVSGRPIDKQTIDTELILRERVMKKYLTELYGRSPLARARIGASIKDE